MGGSGSGGARLRSGPPPDPSALKRDRDSHWLELPRAGREGPPPEWPLTGRTKREAELWGQEWRRPQALVWEANGQVLEVALYVRTLRRAEAVKASKALLSELRIQMDSLGLTIPGMLRLHWRIVGEPSPMAKPAGSVRSAKARLQLVSGGA